MNAIHDRDAAADARLMEASEWVLRLQAGNFDEQTTAQWLEWCQRDAENAAAFEGVSALWQTFDDPRLRTSLKLDLPQATAVVKSPWRNRRLPLALAASLVLAVGAVAWLARRDFPRGVHVQALSTAVGSLSRQTLPDGSTVELGARSAVRVQLTRQSRNFVIDSGEAYFKVAKDPNRPFVVQAGELRVVALGTAFNVRKSRDRIIVTVQEGAVRVASHDTAAAADSSTEMRAGAGHQVVYSTRGDVLSMAKIATPVQKPAAWQVGRLEFVNEPLTDVIADISRYSSRPITLADESLGALTFTGTLRSDAIDDLLSAIEQVFPVEVVDRGEGDIVIAPRVR